MTFDDVCRTLLRSKEPSIRWKVRVNVMGDDPSSPRTRRLREEVRRSARVKALLARRDPRGFLLPDRHPYAKWQGAHWVMAALADIGHPEGDRSLAPMRDQILDRWLSPAYFREFDAATKAAAYRGTGVPRVRGRYRRCASQQGNALYSLIKLGLTDDRLEALVERLLHWQWPDGGWNCDRRPEADTSSFWESRLPMLGLAAYADSARTPAAADAARRASEVFLSRELFLGRHTGKVMNEEFLVLHYPLYYAYDILGGLKAMAEIDRIRDPRCRKALDLLESKQLPGGGWAAEGRLYKVSSALETRADSVDWGGARRTVLNEWVTAEALYVLRAAGRW
ncbi:MAG TPA: hypothetical protein VI999_07700 [Thermoplasmata archaeon]|nr:hypothetical protein [Thermoplasmata archaeon]